jgi:predicted CxxxxCH...CXXCH cytochrome family protein
MAEPRWACFTFGMPLQGVPVLRPDRSRRTLATLATLATLGLIAAASLSACGSSRKVADDRPICQRCHGGTSGNAAPPTSVAGATATTDPKVGAHQAHLVAGRLRGPVACAECHVVPADMQAHEAGIAAIVAGTAQRVVFGPLGAKGAAGAAYDAAGTLRCSNTYCHGATLNHGGTNQAPTWTGADAGHTQAACGTCHFQRGDAFPPGHPTGNDNCNACHPESVLPGNTAINLVGGKHLNGAIDGGCTSCHAAPPATGAHLAHAAADAVSYGDTRGTSAFRDPTTVTYAFGCGNCHPLSLANHLNGTVNVTLDPAGAPAGSLRSFNDPAAAYDPVAKTCSGVYCHSSGQANPGYVGSPGWTSGSKLGCNGCHANPPNYVSGAAGSASANGHVGRFTFNANVIASGHFAGLPAALHQGSAHGGGIGTQFAGDSAAPITCQTCHYRTADPGNTGPSGFYYLDTSGLYDQAGATGTAMVVACASCHDGGVGSPAQGTGSVMPYFHVNGARDVAFDARLDLVTLAGIALPTGTDRPTRPYWYTRATTDNISGIPSPVVQNLASLTGGTLDGTTYSLDLSGAAWDPTSKSCSGVACHLNAANRAPIQWGEPFGTCSVCHNQ